MQGSLLGWSCWHSTHARLQRRCILLLCHISWSELQHRNISRNEPVFGVLPVVVMPHIKLNNSAWRQCDTLALRQ